MVDDVNVRTIRRRAWRVVAGDTARLFGLTVLVVVLGANLRALLVPRAGWWVFAVLVVVPLLVVSRSALITAMAGRGAGAAGPARLARRVLALALDQGVNPPAVHRWPGPVVNAYSLGSGRRASLHVGDAAVDALDGDELDAVLLHELHHLRPAAQVRAGAWLVVVSVATAFLVLPVVALLLLCVLTTLRRPGRLLLAVLGGPRGVGALVAFEVGTPIALLWWPSRLRTAADHRRDLLADLAAAVVVGPAAVDRALGALRAALPSPAEVDAARSTAEPTGLAPRLGRRCTVPVLGRHATDLTPTPTSLERRRQVLATLVDPSGGRRSRTTRLPGTL